MRDTRNDIPGSKGNGHDSSVWELVKSLRDDAFRLLRDEARLVRSEAKDELNQIASDYARLTFAFVMLQAGFILVLFGLSDVLQLAIGGSGITVTVTEAGALLTTGIISVLSGGVWMYRRLKLMGHNRMRMDRTAESWRNNKEWLQDNLTRNDRWSEK